MLVLFLTQYFFPQPSPQKTLETGEAGHSAAGAEAAPLQPTGDSADARLLSDRSRAADFRAATPSRRMFIKVVFSNHGAVVRSWELKQYRDGTGSRYELVNTIGAAKTHYPFSLTI